MADANYIAGRVQMARARCHERDLNHQRIIAMRHAIHEGLKGHADDRMRQRYLAQRGMFTYTGLAEDQVLRLREEHGVYLLRSGRMCVAGLNASNVEYVARAIGTVLSSGA